MPTAPNPRWLTRPSASNSTSARSGTALRRATRGTWWSSRRRHRVPRSPPRGSDELPGRVVRRARPRGERAAAAHSLKPEQIVHGLASDPALRDSAGVVRVRQDPKLPRLLLIEVTRSRWETVAAADRTRVAEEWWETWRHNVPSGVVAVLDTATQRSLVNYDAQGRARLVENAPRDNGPAPRSADGPECQKSLPGGRGSEGEPRRRAASHPRRLGRHPFALSHHGQF